MKNYLHAVSNFFASKTMSSDDAARESNPFLLRATHYAYKNKMLILMGVILGVFSIILFSLVIGLHHDSAHIVSQQSAQNTHTNRILSQITDMNRQLQLLQESPQNSAAFKDSFVKINEDLSNVQQTLSTIQTDMDTQMSDLKKAIQADPNRKQYLDRKELPFQVISIDVMAEQPMVSIDYDHHRMPMMIGDAQAGWELVQADFSTATAEFKNETDQYIKVIIQG